MKKKLSRLRKHLPFKRRTRIVSSVMPRVGSVPGSLEYLGKAVERDAVMEIMRYDADSVLQQNISTVKEAVDHAKEGDIFWLNVDGLHNLELMHELGEAFQIHPLVLEDIVHTGQRPKVEEMETALYIVIRMIYYHEGETELQSEQVSLVLGSHYVISFQETEGDVFEPVRERIRESRGRIRLKGHDYLAYALLDIIIDHYFEILESMNARVEELEAELYDAAGPEYLVAIAEFRRELILLRKAVWPVRELLSKLEQTDSDLLHHETRPFIRDAYDHAVQVIDSIESLRDMVGVLRDSYQSIVGNRMNEIMKVLTIMATIFIPLTFIAGIYGMNFDNMPELHAENGYPIALGAMAVLGLGLAGYFRWKKWI